MPAGDLQELPLLPGARKARDESDRDAPLGRAGCWIVLRARYVRSRPEASDGTRVEPHVQPATMDDLVLTGRVAVSFLP